MKTLQELQVLILQWAKEKDLLKLSFKHLLKWFFNEFTQA